MPVEFLPKDDKPSFHQKVKAFAESYCDLLEPYFTFRNVVIACAALIGTGVVAVEPALLFVVVVVIALLIMAMVCVG